MKKQFVVKRDGQKNLRFTGEEIVWVTGQKVSGPGQNRWCELTLYKTDKGQYVVYEVYKTAWQGESNRYTATICDTPKEVYNALLGDYGGDGPILTDLAKDLLEQAGLVDKDLQGLMVEDI